MKNNGRVHKVMDRWFDQIMAYSPQDQISFPYALATGPWSAPRHRASTAGFPEGSLRTATEEGGLVVAQLDDGYHEEIVLYKKRPRYWYLWGSWCVWLEGGPTRERGVCTREGPPLVSQFVCRWVVCTNDLLIKGALWCVDIGGG